MPKDESANVLDSLDSKTRDEKSPDEGEKSKGDLEKKVREELRAEYERKANEKIEEEKSRLTNSYEEKIREILDKDRITVSDQNKIDILQKKILEIKADPNFDPWNKIIRDTIREEIDQSENGRYENAHKASQEKANIWLEAKAKDLGVKVRELSDELMPFLEDRYLDHLPEDRVKMAFDMMNRIKEKYSGQKKDNTVEHSEGGGRVTRKITPKEGIAESRKTDNWRNLLSAVAEKQSLENK